MPKIKSRRRSRNNIKNDDKQLSIPKLDYDSFRIILWFYLPPEITL
ncbi:2032_t:CDS:1, partial [Scutellospora calospora]